MDQDARDALRLARRARPAGLDVARRAPDARAARVGRPGARMGGRGPRAAAPAPAGRGRGVIRVAGNPGPPVRRLIAGLEGREPAIEGPATLVVGAGSLSKGERVEALVDERRPARLLLLSALGAHPDARDHRLRSLWDIEEAARATGLPLLTLRLGPLVGPESPLWQRLRSRPRLPRRGEALLMPVVEEDVVEALAQALD